MFGLVFNHAVSTYLDIVRAMEYQISYFTKPRAEASSN